MIKSLKELKNELKFFKKLLKIYNKYVKKIGFYIDDKIEDTKKVIDMLECEIRNYGHSNYGLYYKSVGEEDD